MIDTQQLIYLLWTLSLLVFVVGLVGIYFALRARLDSLRTLLDRQQTEIELLQRMWRLVQDEERDSRAREVQLQERIALLSRQQEQLMLRDSDTEPYFQAIREAQDGATSEQLIEHTGVSRGEAELIVALHAQPPSRRG